MISVTIEQRIVVKFHFKLGKTATETYNLLKEVYGSESLSRARVFEWFKRFKDGREDVEDDSRPGRPSTSKTDDNVKKVGNLIRSDRRLSIRAIAETVGIDKECVRQILHDSFNMQKVCVCAPAHSALSVKRFPEVAVSTGPATAGAAPRTACANCGGDASGLQWWCVSLGYRACAECATRDSTGYWLRAPEGRPEGEVAALIAALRRELNLFRSIKEEPAEIPVELDEPGVTDDGAEPEILVKEEPKEEPDDDPLSLNLESNPLVLCPREQSRSEHVVPHSKAAAASRKRKAPEQATPWNDPVDPRPHGPPADPTPHSATSIYLKPEATTLQRLSQTAIPTHSLDPRPSPPAVISSMAHTQQSGTQKKQPRRTK